MWGLVSVPDFGTAAYPPPPRHQSMAWESSVWPRCRPIVSTAGRLPRLLLTATLIHTAKLVSVAANWNPRSGYAQRSPALPAQLTYG